MGSLDKTVRLWEATSGDPVHVLSGHSGWPIHLAFSPSGHQIFSGSNKGTIGIWDLSPDESNVPVRFRQFARLNSGQATGYAFSAIGPQIVINTSIGEAIHFRDERIGCIGTA